MGSKFIAGIVILLFNTFAIAELVDTGKPLDNYSPFDVATGDFNEDGNLDIVEVFGRAAIWFGDGDGGFVESDQQIVGNVIGTGFFSVLVGHFNTDSHLDLFFGTSTFGPSQVWFGDGFGNFTDSGMYYGDTWPNQLATGDFDENGALDVVVTEVSSGKTGREEVWLGDGTGGFTQLTQDLNAGVFSFQGAAVADFDEDGHDDIL